MKTRRTLPRAALSLALLATLACSAGRSTAPRSIVDVAADSDRTPLNGSPHLVDDIEPRNGDGTVNVVVEIPAGTVDKWEVDKRDGALRWEIADGVPRVVRYLGYPGNYGMVPRSLLPETHGGDGDPLDVLVLGPAVARGSILPVRLLGVLKMLDNGEADDKLIAVPADGPLAEAATIADLDRRFPGVTEIVELWFANYKGPARVKTDGYRDRETAERILDAALTAYRAPAVPAGT